MQKQECEADLYRCIGSILEAQNSPKQALKAYTYWLGSQLPVSDKSKTDIPTLRERANTYESIARLLLAQHDPTRSLHCLQQALKLREQVAELHANNAACLHDLCACYLLVGDCLLVQEDYKVAISMFSAAQRIAEQVADQDQSDRWKQTQATVIAYVAYCQGQLKRAAAGVSILDAIMCFHSLCAPIYLNGKRYNSTADRQYDRCAALAIGAEIAEAFGERAKAEAFDHELIQTRFGPANISSVFRNRFLSVIVKRINRNYESLSFERQEEIGLTILELSRALSPRERSRWLNRSLKAAARKINSTSLIT